jgi:hypothetical protein
VDLNPKEMKKIICLLCCLLSLEACQQEELANPDYLVFGHFYGFCQGERCVEIFRVDPRNLYEDTKDVYPTSTRPYEGNYVLQSDPQYQKVRDLSNHIPAKLLKEENTVIGQPDAGDWGGIYIEIKKNRQHRFFLIDKKRENIPAYLHPFIEEVEAAIAQLQ